MILNTCINDDSLKWMKSIKDPFANMIIADPPFNIDFQYDICNDDLSDDDFLAWSFDWITEAKRLLLKDGNLLICMGDKYVSDIDIICRKKLNLIRKNWIIWNYSFGQSGILDTRKAFTCSKTHILRYVKNNKFYFDAAAVAVPSARATKYSDKRADSRGKCPDDVFTMKRIAGSHNDRVKGINTQMPVKLMETWIKAMCPPNGVVFDPFPGSGSSLIAAKRSGRQYLGIELSPNYTKIILSRLI